jgi:DeoD family purine-nucleoside phosphorylase
LDGRGGRAAATSLVGVASERLKLSPMPIHVRAEPGDYAEACLLPGDPLRAKYIAETYFDDPTPRNTERGMLGFSGTYEGKPVSVQATGMGCPSAAIVMEELIQLGVKRFLRVGTCGGLQNDLQLGDLVIAVSAVAADGTARHYVDDEPHTPTADWELVHGAVHAAKELGQPVRVGAVVSSDTFYDPDHDRHTRWSERGVLAVEMEAAVLFTIGALRGVQSGALLTVSDYAVHGEAVARISDEDLRAAVDRMTRVALQTVTASH